MNNSATQPLVSVIMPCYKMGRFIGEALESVGAQTYTNWEVIAVDDCGPEDGTREAVEAFAKQFPNHRVIYHRHEKNGGVSAARNTAIELAQGVYLAFLDPDDWWANNKIEKQIKKISESLENVALYSFGKILKQDSYSGYMPDSETMGRAYAESALASVADIIAGRVLFPFSSFLVRKKNAMAVGNFQLGLPFQNEDRLLVATLAANYDGIIGIKEPLCSYRAHSNSATAGVLKQNIQHLIEFDLAARCSLGLKKNHPQLDDILRICRSSFLKMVAFDHWHPKQGIVIDLAARLAVAFPQMGLFFAKEFARNIPIFFYLKRWLRLKLSK